MNDIFISYSRKDKDWVETLALALEAEGYDVWWDPEILPGQDFEKIIEEALSQTHCLLTIWSENSIQSHWVRAETSQGLADNVYVPVLYQQVKIPMQFRHIHSDDLIDWQGKTTDPRYQKLLRAIALKVKPSQAKAEKIKKKEVARLAEERKQRELEEAKAAKQKFFDQFIDNGDGTITDTKTNLMWKKCSEGLSGEQCEQGEAKEYTWDEAMALAKKTQYATYSDWRLPTIDELRSLVYCSNGIAQSEAWDYTCYGNGNKGGEYQQPTINQIAFPKTKISWYWSSSPLANYVDSALVIYFGYGYDYADDKSNGYHIRLVRSGQ